MTLAKEIILLNQGDDESQYCDEDEDVTMKGTPLHEYLDKICLCDDEADVNYKNYHIIDSSSNFHRFWHGISLKEYLQVQWKACRASLSIFFPFTDDFLIKMSQIYYSKYGREILESKVMLEEDLDYLCLQSPQQFLNCVKKRENETFSLTDSMRHEHTSRHAMLICCYIACLVAFLLSPVVPTIIFVCLASFAFFVTCFNLRLQIIIEMWKRRHDRNLELLHNFLSSSEKFHSLVRRAVRLIQDIEVVGRGYTLVNGKTPVSRMESDNPLSTRAFLKLRIMLLRSMVKCILLCRKAMHTLVQYQLPDDGNNALDACYICNMPLSELGICFSEEASEGEIYQATDGCALSVLKTLNEILYKQRSEFLTRLSLILSGQTWNFLPEGFQSSFASILSRPYQGTVDSVASLQSSYEMHKYLTTTKSENENVCNSENADCSDEISKKTSSLRINLHSLQAHMRAALYKSIMMEDSIFERSKTEVEITDSFENLKMHLDVSLECWNQCMKEVDLLYGRLELSDSQQQGDAVATPIESDEESSPNNESNIVEAFHDEENMEDQVFEATTEGRIEEDGDSTQYEEGASDKKALEESDTVIRELRSVLAVKTSKEQREMWKRQLFPSYKPKHYEEEKEETLSPENSSKEERLLTPVGALSFSRNDVSNLVNENDSATDFSVETSNLKDDNTESSQPKHVLASQGLDQPLSFLKRPKPPGHLPTLRKYREKPGNTHIPHSEISLNSDHIALESNPSTQAPENGKTSFETSEEKSADWTAGLGIGFSGSLALQAVSMARQRNHLAANRNVVSYGSDSSDDEKLPHQ